MLILIAESKTMLSEQQSVSAETLANHTPAGEKQASEIMSGLEKLSQPELIAETGFSSTLAAKLREMIYEFPNTTVGMEAIRAFTGVVFKALDYDVLGATAQARCRHDVRIVSSLYGLLRPDDIIKPYRLDFTTHAAPNGETLSAYWKKDVTIALVRTIRDGGFGEVLNLLPADAAKCIDWKIVKRFAKVWKTDFVEMTDAGKARTPGANKLKTMRGTLLRYILTHADIERIDGLAGIATDNFLPLNAETSKATGVAPRYPDQLTFLC